MTRCFKDIAKIHLNFYIKTFNFVRGSELHIRCDTPICGSDDNLITMDGLKASPPPIQYIQIIP